jgi:septal ring factor EnvC (AmiA/AmiB activator)
MKEALLFYLYRFLLVVLILFIPAISFSEPPTQEYQLVQKKIMVSKNKLNEAIEKEKTAIKDISNVKQQLNKLNKSIEALRTQTAELKNGIYNSRLKLASISVTLTEQRNQLKKKIQILQKLSNPANRSFILISTEDFYKIQRVNRYMSVIVEDEFIQISNYSKTYNDLKDKEKIVKDTLLIQNNEFHRLKKMEEHLIKLKQDKQSVMLASKEEQAQYQEELRELEAISKKLNDLIGSSNNKVKYYGKGFSKTRGHLNWPVSGEIAIPYGSQEDPRFKSPIFRNGIFIKSDTDENVRAIFSGKVVFADQFRGLGNVVIINHGEGYHSVYANLNKISINNGDNIAEKDIIGKAGVPEPINSPGIYFEVRFKGKPINPTRWLSKGNTP